MESLPTHRTQRFNPDSGDQRFERQGADSARNVAAAAIEERQLGGRAFP
jgi:hypothetical protein